jgi:hypothetical protein
MSDKTISIMIVQMSDGWHVVAFVDGVSVQTSPAIASRAKARREAQMVAERFKAKVARKALA